MARQHASQAKRYREESKVPAWVWLFTGAVLGAFIMFLMHLSDIETPQTSENTIDVESKENKRQTPRFDFYDLLKETKIPTTSSAAETLLNEGETVHEESFILQVASFKSSSDAEQLRAELILLNLDAFTQEAKIRNGETWHRVLVGPFQSKSKLAKARSTLLTNKHEALVLKQRP